MINLGLGRKYLRSFNVYGSILFVQYLRLSTLTSIILHCVHYTNLDSYRGVHYKS